MEGSSIKKCRTCLKSSSESFPLHKVVIGSRTKATYLQLLQECANLEFTTDYEYLMPQDLCVLCCQELSDAYNFVLKAQYCNNKLKSLIGKQLPGVVEKSPLIQNGKLFRSYQQSNKQQAEGDLQKNVPNNFRIVNTSVLLNPVELEETTEPSKPNISNSIENNDKDIFDSTTTCSTNITSSTLTYTTCPICEKAVNGYNSLITHIRIQHDVEAPRKYLNTQEEVNTNNETTEKQEPKKKTFKCCACNYTARSFLALSYHNRLTHGTEEDKFQCNFCPYKSFKKISLFLHVKNSHRERLKTLKADAENKLDQSERNESFDLPFKHSLTDENNQTINIYENKAEKSQTVTVCNICEENLSTHENLVKHMRSHHGNENSSKFIRRTRLQAKEIFGCKLCCSKYTNKYSYLHHLKHKHNIDERRRKEKLKDKVIKCRSCDYTARTYAALNYHTRSKHGSEKDKFKCKFCTHMCLKKFDLLTHVKNTHKELIKSLKAEAENNRVQGEAASDTLNFNSSKLGPTQEENSGEESSSDDNIPLIKKINNSTSNSKHKIKEDRELFSDEEFIRNILNIKKRLIKSSTRSLARRCDECGNIYKNYKALYAHQKHVHISEDKYSLCAHCGKKYKRKTDLRIHIEKAHIPKISSEIAKQPAKIREKRFMCTECSYVCTTITILNIHVNRHHTGEKPYKCDICFKSFIVPYDLKIHRYLHTGERPYKCPICSKGFRDNSHMIKHKRIHSSERPYKCKDCGKSFAQSYNLSVHKRTHLKERKLNCIICGKVFQNRSLLNLHRINENHHDEIT